MNVHKIYVSLLALIFMKKVFLIVLLTVLCLSVSIHSSYSLKPKRRLLLVGATAYRSLIEMYPTNDVEVTYLGYGSDFPDSLKELKQYDVIMFANIDIKGFNPPLSDDEMNNISL